MPKTPYKLLVIDIDGTLLNKQGVISDKDHKALTETAATGITVALCTGRVAQASRHIMDSLSLDGYHIFADGAIVLNPDTGDEVYEEPLTSDIVRQLIEFSHRTGLHFDFYSGTKFFVEQFDWQTDIRHSFFKLDPTIVDFDTIWQKERIIKGTVVTNTDEERDIARKLPEIFGSSLNFTWTSTPRFPDINFINIIDTKVSKGKALRELCSFLNIHPEEAMAIGDGDNDISLLKNAGLSVAMGNGRPSLKDIAHHVTLDVEQSGVAAAIREFLL